MGNVFSFRSSILAEAGNTGEEPVVDNVLSTEEVSELESKD
jgi:hypothetical protein